MMRKITNGIPVVHRHSCPEDMAGSEMTAEQIRGFAVECLMDEYRQAGTEVEELEPGSGADFRFTNKRDGKTTNVLVVCSEDPYEGLDGIDVTWLQDEYLRTGAWPRVTVARPWCVEKGCKDGLPWMQGGRFCFAYNPISVIPGEENAPLEKHLTPVDLAVRFQQAWRTLEVSAIEPYLDKDFHYGSDWVFDEIPSRKEFLEYLKGKFYSVRRTMNDPETGVFRERATGKVGLLVNENGHSSLLEIGCEDGRITDAKMSVYKDSYKEYDPEDDMYQVHGDHLDGIMPADVFMANHFQEAISESTPWKTCCGRVCTPEIPGRKTEIVSLKYGDGPMSYLSVLAKDSKENSTMFLTSYPMMEGKDLKVKVKKVREWDNMAEAIIECEAGEFSFSFFAVDYYANKSRYQVGKELTVNLAALAMSAREARRELVYEGEEAVKWIEKVGRNMGREVEYEKDGSVKPVRFSLEKLVAYINFDQKAPDEAQFQSPFGNLESCSFLGVDFWKGDICVHRDSETDDRLEVPLYLRKEMLPDAVQGDPVSGVLWMTGCIAGMNGKDRRDITTGDRMGMFVDFMESIRFRKGFSDLNMVTDQLGLISIREGYVFDAFLRGTEGSDRFQGYCCQAGQKRQYLPHDKEWKMTEEQMRARKKATPYSDECYIHDRHPDFEVDDIPSVLGYISVPFTDEGIMQAWLLENIHEFMGRTGNEQFDDKTFITDWESITKICTEDDVRYGKDFQKAVEQIRAIDPEILMPRITVNGEVAEVELTYWSDWKGLVRYRTTARRSGESMTFDEPQTQILVAFCSELDV